MVGLKKQQGGLVIKIALGIILACFILGAINITLGLGFVAIASKAFNEATKQLSSTPNGFKSQSSKTTYPIVESFKSNQPITRKANANINIKPEQIMGLAIHTLMDPVEKAALNGLYKMERSAILSQRRIHENYLKDSRQREYPYQDNNFGKIAQNTRNNTQNNGSAKIVINNTTCTYDWINKKLVKTCEK